MFRQLWLQHAPGFLGALCRRMGAVKSVESLSNQPCQLLVYMHVHVPLCSSGLSSVSIVPWGSNSVLLTRTCVCEGIVKGDI